MGYQLIVDAIRAAAEGVNPSGTFIHGRRTDGSIEYSEPMPQVHLYPFTTTIALNEVTDSSDIVMGFWFQDAPDTSNEQREAIIAQADTLCRAFLNALQSSPARIDNIKAEPQYRTLSATLSGYALRFTLITKAKLCP